MERVGSLTPMPPTLPARDAAPEAVGGDARAQRVRVHRADAEELVARSATATSPSRWWWSRTVRPIRPSPTPVRSRPTTTRPWSCSPVRSPTTARRCAQVSSPARGDVVVVFDVDYFDPAFVDVVLPRLTEPGGPAIVVGSKRAPGTRDTRPWPRRAITAGFSTMLRSGSGCGVSDTHGMKGMRRADRRADRASVPQRHRSLRHRARAAGRPRRAGGAEVPVTVEERRPARTPIASRIARTMFGLVRLRHPALARTVGTIVTAPRFAAALSEHPVASHAVGEVAGEVLERVRRRRARPAGAVRLAALRRRDGRPHVRAVEPPRHRAWCSAPASSAWSAVPTRWRTPPAWRCSRPRAPTPCSRRSSLDVERTPDGAAVTGWPDLERRPVDPAPAGRSVQLPARRLPRPSPRGPSRPPGDRGCGVGGAGSGRQPAGARRAHRRDRRGRRVPRGAPGARGGVAGMPTGGRAVRHHPRRGEPHRGARRVAPPSIACRTPRPTAERGGPRADARRSAPRASSSTSTSVDFERGDFLVRNVLGGDAETGAIVVGRRHRDRPDGAVPRP